MRFDDVFRATATAVLLLFTATSQSASAQNLEDALRLNEDGIRYYAQERYTDAELALKEALRIRESILSSDSPDVGQTAFNLAEVYRAQERNPDAEMMYKRALPILEKLNPQHPVITYALNGLAKIYKSENRDVDYASVLREIVDIKKLNGDEDSAEFAYVLQELGDTFESLGKNDDAEPLLRQALKIRVKVLGSNDPAIAANLNSLARVLWNKRRREEAAQLYKKSLSINEKETGNDSEATGAVVNNLAVLYYENKQFLEAERFFKRSLHIFRNRHGQNHPNVAQLLTHLAIINNELGRPIEAEQLASKAVGIFTAVYGVNHPQTLQAMNVLAVNYRELKRLDISEATFRKIIAECEVGKNYQVRVVCNSASDGLIETFNQHNRFDDALKIAMPRIKNRSISQDVALRTLVGAEEVNLMDHREAADLSYQLVQTRMNSAAAEAVSMLGQRFAYGHSELAALVREDQDLATESSYLDKELISSISRASYHHDAGKEEKIQRRIDEIAVRRDRIQLSLNQRFPDYTALSKPIPLSVSDTQKLLDDEEAIVVIYAEEKHNYVWAVTKTDVFWTNLTLNNFSDEVSELRQSLAIGEVAKPFNTALSFKIYQQTIGLIANKIVGKSRISIVSNGALTSIPLGLLITKDPFEKSLKDIDWLVKSHAITIIPSIHGLKIMRAQMVSSSAPKVIIAFGDPVFSNAAKAEARSNPNASMRSLTNFYDGTQVDLDRLGKRLPQLPATRQEVVEIGNSLGANPEDIRLGLDATETAVKNSELDRYRVVYFATHGLVAGEVAEFNKAKAEPALVLSIPEKATEIDDGLLQASEVAQLKLNADWAVLSACNTASSDGAGAEALSGLARAFLYAGARSLVVSHWNVEDEATRALMSGLFEIFAKNPSLSHGEVMQKATLRLIETAKTEDEAHPRYWAPFVVIGEPAKPR